MKVVATWLLAALIACALPSGATGQTGVRIIVNGVQIPLAAPAVVSNGQVLAPIPGLFEPMGALAAFYEVDRSIVVTNRVRTTVRMKLGDTSLQVNGQSRPLPAAPAILSGQVFVPAQPVFQALGAWTKWEETERTLYVSSQIMGLSAQVIGGALQVKVDATGPVQAETHVLSQPDRLVVDFLHAALRAQERTIAVSDAGVVRIRAAQFQIKPYISRMVFDLREPVEVRVNTSPTTYLVTVEVRPRATSASPPASPPGAGPRERGSPPAAGGAVKVLGVAFQANGDAARVTIDATGAVQYKIREFVFPDRLAIDLENAVFVPVKQDLPVEHPSVVVVRAAQFTADPAVTRVVVTLKRKLNYVVTQSGGPIIIDLNAVVAGRGHVVAIDPGHGGRDPGATGPSGLREADVVLDISLRVRELLTRDGVRNVILRESDVTVELPDRPRLARDAGATIFVSIHANANGRATVNGSETYFLTPQSLALAQMIQDELGVVLGIPSRGIKTANFLVLRDNGVPSVLVEAAFISNAEDEARLRDAAFRQRIAGAIHKGVMRFLAIYPAPVSP
ncbi:MAG TPA: N-acetylmuramoyl-L-alanine amidase family protein [bacterium]|nr:N-acetylmuramoyl-L-alanine amidase family protein [bacterium]